MPVSSDFAVGHERFNAGRELVQHLLGEPHEVVIETQLYKLAAPAEIRANGFAAAPFLPSDGSGVRALTVGPSADIHFLGAVFATSA